MYKSEVFRAWSLVLQLGLSMLVPVFLLIAIAIFLKDRFAIDLMLVAVILGIFVGARNVYVIIKGYLKSIDNKGNTESELLKKHMKNIHK